MRRRLTDFFGQPCKQLAPTRRWYIVYCTGTPEPLSKVHRQAPPNALFPTILGGALSWFGCARIDNLRFQIRSCPSRTGDWRWQLFSGCTVIATGVVRARDRGSAEAAAKEALASRKDLRLFRAVQV